MTDIGGIVLVLSIVVLIGAPKLTEAEINPMISGDSVWDRWPVWFRVVYCTCGAIWLAFAIFVGVAIALK